MGFTNIDSHFPFVGGIDVILDIEFSSIINPPLVYHIIEVHDSNMIRVTTRMGQGNDRAPPRPPWDVGIQQPLPKPQVQIQAQLLRAPITIQT